MQQGQCLHNVIHGVIDQVPPPMPIFPLKQKLIKAIENNQLTTWPGLIVKAVEKYLPNHASATQTRAI